MLLLELGLERAGLDQAADLLSRDRVEPGRLVPELLGPLDRLHLVLAVEHDRVSDLALQLVDLAQGGEIRSSILPPGLLES